MTHPAPADRHWHAEEVAALAEEFGVAPGQGLAANDAAARLLRHGPNRPPRRAGRGALARFADQLVQPLVLVLIASGVVTALLGEWVDAGVILGVVLVNAIIGFAQEGKAVAALAALARAVATEATVLRDGRRQRIDAEGLVPGDVVILAAGDRAPADLRLFAARELRVVEAMLTGEASAVSKSPPTLAADTPLADRRNMAFAGTIVVAGQGGGLVVATGGATETGRIAELIADAPDLATPLTRKMEAFARRLLVVILVLAALTFLVGWARGESAFAMFMAAVALAVGAIPEGLPAAVTITLAIGVGRMAKRRAIIRRLPAVETLGSTTVICTDKTGTLTENAMTVGALWAAGRRYRVAGQGYAPKGEIADVESGDPAPVTGALREALIAGALCNDAALHGEQDHWRTTGDPTEAALLVVARKGGFDETTLRHALPRIDELPFDAERRAMATLHEVEGRRIVYVKGAVETLLPACVAMLDADGRPQSVDAAAIQSEARALAADGLRVLALARAETTSDALTPDDMTHGLVFLGLAGMHDPPRRQAMAAVRACHTAGIRVKMITGDHADTARAIAARIGIGDGAAAVLTGRELALLDTDALRVAAARTDVFARVEPEQKLRLVQALQANGEIVAMTGDGVNDAPALKTADIGIAMGQSGTEVAKEAAAMVLVDDNFATIEAAIEEGRGIHDNLVKFITWTLPTNIGEGLVILAAVFVGTTLPITPLQILWINMTTAVLLGLMLAFEPTESDVMRRPPRPPAQPLLDRVLVERTLLVSLLLLVGAFGLFNASLARGLSLAEARTVAVNIFVAGEIAYLFNCRSLGRPLVAVPAFSNPWVWWGVVAMVALQLAFTYLPVMNRLFATAPLAPAAWAEIVAFAVALLATMEAEKAWRLRAACRSAG